MINNLTLEHNKDSLEKIINLTKSKEQLKDDLIVEMVLVSLDLNLI